LNTIQKEVGGSNPRQVNDLILYFFFYTTFGQLSYSGCIYLPLNALHKNFRLM